MKIRHLLPLLLLAVVAIPARAQTPIVLEGRTLVQPTFCSGGVVNGINPDGTVSCGVGGSGGANFPPGTGIPQITGGVAWSTTLSESGTGNVCLTTNCVMVTPNLGTPSAINLANALNLPCAAMPAFTGDVTTIAGNCTTTVTRINGLTLPASTPIVGTNGGGQIVAAWGHNLAQVLTCADSSGSGSVQSCSTTPTFTPQAGDFIAYKTTTTNTGDLTINVDATSPIHVRKWLGTAVLAAGDMPAGVYEPLYFDGTFWEALSIGNAPASSGFANPMTTLGDLIFENNTPAPARLPGPTGINGIPYVLTNAPSAGLATTPAWVPGGVQTNAQTGTTYPIVATDRASYISFSNAAAIAVSLPQAGSAGFANNFVFVTCDIGAGTATITPATSTISYSTGGGYTGAAANMPLSTGQCAWVYSDNSNYFAIRFSTGGGGTVTSVATSAPLSGGAITTTGTLSCPTCVTASSPGAGIPHFAGGTQAVTSSAVTGSDMANNTVTATQLAAQYSKGSCTELWGGSGTSFALTAGDDAISNNSCYNDSGVTRTITAVKCRSDIASNTTTVNPTFGAAGTGTTVLSGALTCGSSLAYSSSGTVSNASWTTGTGITPAMGGTLTGTSIAMIVEYTY